MDMRNVIALIAPPSLTVSTLALSETFTGWTRFAVTVAGGVVTVVAGFYAIKRLRNQSIAAQMVVCDECRKGNEPLECPFEKRGRPINCPKNTPIHPLKPKGEKP